jgi:hypothetical protein
MGDLGLRDGNDIDGLCRVVCQARNKTANQLDSSRKFRGERMTAKKLRIPTLVKSCREWEVFRAGFLMSDRKEMVAYCDIWLARLSAEIASLHRAI